MQAIAQAVCQRIPETRILYVGAEQFINEVIESIHSRTMPEFRRRYRADVDLFLVDDVHFLEGKEMTQEEFFHTFNALYEGNKQIVLTSDRPPKEIPGLEARLVSRFEWGMVADIGQPDLEHRIAILRKKQEQDHLELTIPDDVLRFIAEHVRSNVRELEGCIIKLLLFASLKHKEVSIELAREALSDRIRPGEDSAERAKGAARRSTRCRKSWRGAGASRPEGLRSKARIKTLTVPRQIAMYLARELLEMQLVEIGQAFGGRDHSTVIHSVDKVSRQMSRDRSISRARGPCAPGVVRRVIPARPKWVWELLMVVVKSGASIPMAHTDSTEESERQVRTRGSSYRAGPHFQTLYYCCYLYKLEE